MFSTLRLSELDPRVKPEDDNFLIMDRPINGLRTMLYAEFLSLMRHMGFVGKPLLDQVLKFQGHCFLSMYDKYLGTVSEAGYPVEQFCLVSVS